MKVKLNKSCLRIPEKKGLGISKQTKNTPKNRCYNLENFGNIILKAEALKKVVEHIAQSIILRV